MIQKIILLIGCIALLNGCTKDDICDPNTATTPLLIISFKDVASPSLDKPVPNLSVQSTDEEQNFITLESESPSTIAIPLRASDVATRYLFTINTESETSEITDALTFTYTTEDIYINRACSFKTIYSNLSVTDSDTDTEDWIVSFDILNPIVEDETEAHITIFH